MRFFLIQDTFQELPDWPAEVPAQGFIWVPCTRSTFEQKLEHIQHHLQRLGGGGLVDLHVSDLLNPQIPSQYDYTSWYDVLVFRRLSRAQGAHPQHTQDAKVPALAAIDTSPVGFAVFDRLLLTVHPEDCAIRDYFQQRYSQLGQGNAASPTAKPQKIWPVPMDLDAEVAHIGVDPILLEEQRETTRARSEARGPSRLPPSPADLMVRMVNHMVDGYLDLRRLLSSQLGTLQQNMLRRGSKFRQWHALLSSRNTLHLLEDICEDQRSALQEWIEALEDWPTPTDPVVAREREVLRVRSRDVQEHIERVLNHVRRLESSSESAVQMHFSIQGSRTNDIMRSLTALTAIFLPLNLITGVFGMNFDALPLIHSSLGFWFAFALMGVIVAGLIWWFKRNRYWGD